MLDCAAQAFGRAIEVPGGGKRLEQEGMRRCAYEPGYRKKENGVPNGTPLLF
jgi:hypothetical protein